MKWNKFFDDIDYKIMYEVGINKYTIQKLIKVISVLLSPKEKIKYQLKINKILSYINSQITITKFVKQNNIKEFQKELDNLNGKSKSKKI